MNKFVKSVLLGLFYFSVLIGCSYSATDTIDLDETWYTIELPHLFMVDPGMAGGKLDFEHMPLEVKVIKNYAGSLNDLKVRLDGNSVLFDYSPNGEILPPVIEGLQIYGQPLYWYSGKIEVKFLKNKTDPFEEQDWREIEGKLITYNEMLIGIHHIYRGNIEYIQMGIMGGVKNLSKALYELQPIFDDIAEENKQEYLSKLPQIKDVVAEIVNGSSSDLEKARKITEWVSNNIEYDDIDPNGIDISDENWQWKSSVAYSFADRKGYCRPTAYLLKTMLDIEGIKNKIIPGYFPDKSGHVINAIYDKDKDFWIRMDGTVGEFHTPAIYHVFEESREIPLVVNQ
jgi:hypothetical protein